MSYAAGTDKFLELYHRAMPSDFYTYPVEEQRRLYLSLSEVFPYPLPAGVAASDDVVHWQGRTLRVRLYRPARRARGGLLVYMRGGGFVVGSLDSHNTLVAELAQKTGRNTVALDFRQAPEHPFPAALEDCYGALCAIAQRPEAVRLDEDDVGALVLCGDSSGANLAVAISMKCRDEGGPKPRGMGLISPVLDFVRWRGSGEDDPLLGGEMEFYTRSYCPTLGQARHPYASPLVSGEFHDLPPAYVLSAELDSLRADGEKCAEQLRRNGIPVQHVVEPGLVHAPLRGRSLIPQVADAWERFCAAAARLAAGEPVEHR